jgi:hypothetical protein
MLAGFIMPPRRVLPLDMRQKMLALPLSRSTRSTLATRSQFFSASN